VVSVRPGRGRAPTCLLTGLVCRPCRARPQRPEWRTVARSSGTGVGGRGAPRVGAGEQTVGALLGVGTERAWRVTRGARSGYRDAELGPNVRGASRGARRLPAAARPTTRTVAPLFGVRTRSLLRSTEAGAPSGMTTLTPAARGERETGDTGRDGGGASWRRERPSGRAVRYASVGATERPFARRGPRTRRVAAEPDRGVR
jgi:hypothetical protein